MTAMFNAARPVDILLVEDNPDDVELTREALEEGRLANELHVARTAEQALEWLHDRDEPRPNLILLDINLPGMSGLEFLQTIKQDEAFEDIPVVVLTTSQAEEDIDEAYRLHASAFVSKPVGFGEFIGAVQGIGNFYLTLVSLPSGKPKPGSEG